VQLQILPDIAVAAFLVFARIGTLVMLLPVLGEATLPSRFRLTGALLLTLVFYPVARPYYPAELSSFAVVLPLLIGEIVIGFVLGVTGRFLLSSLQTAGVAVAQTLGLGFVTSLDPVMSQQGALVGSFLSLVGVTLIFATDLDHIAIMGLGHSYELFRPGQMPPVGDALRYAVDLTASAFRVGVQIAAPVLVFGFVFNLGLGVLARLMPQMQVFFVGVPASILLGFAVLLLVLAAMMSLFLGDVRTGLGALVGGA
jgi:flagellar biosynthetic protein FliR